MIVMLTEIPSQKEFLIKQSPFRIGRKEDNDLVIMQAIVSKYHCRIIEKNNHYYLMDLNSKNRTYLNSRPVQGEMELSNSDIISIGLQGPAYQFRIKADSPDDFDHTLMRNTDTVMLLKKQIQKKLSTTPKKPVNLFLMGLLVLPAVGLVTLSLFLFQYWQNSSKKPHTAVTTLNYNFDPNNTFSYRDLLLRNTQIDISSRDVRIQLILLLERNLEDTSQIDDDIVSKIRSYIQAYRKSRDYQEGLKRRGEYLSMIEEEFEKANIPKDLSYIAFVESFYLPDAYNRRSGASGMWQFLPATAREYGLRVKGKTDERKDPVKSTRAAARYIQDLISIFGVSSLPLAIASYNAGDQYLRAMLKKITNPRTERNFWYLYKNKLLPRETREYVLKIFALILLTEHPDIE